MQLTKKEFWDVRNHGFARVGFVIPEVSLANPGVNAQRHIEAFEEAYRRGGMYVIAPELGLTGYSCGDLFHQRVLLDAAREALKKVVDASVKWKMIVSVGVPVEISGSVYNCAVTIYQGKVLMVVPKTYPPEYKEFYELRHFARSVELASTDMELWGERVPVGTRLLVTARKHPCLKIHTSVCEDDWTVIPPGSGAALAGATVCANLSASNITIGKEDFRQDLMTMWSALRSTVQIYCAAGAGESTAEMAWDGDGHITERGYVLAKSKRYSQEGQIVLADVDLEMVTQERWWRNSLRQNGADSKEGYQEIVVEGVLGKNSEIFGKFLRQVDQQPFVPSDSVKLRQRTEEVFMIQATGLAQRLRYLNPSMRKIFLGLSGGLDSTHALLVAVKAMEMLNIPRSEIKCLTMPGFGTTARTKGNAWKLAKALGVEIREVNIKKLTKLALTGAEYDFAGEANVGFENAQAWARMYTLFTTSAVKRGIVLGTGDLTELLLGWCTVFADHASHYNVNAGVPKTLIKHEVKFVAEHVFGEEKRVKEVLMDILDTPISPELLPTQRGESTHKTEDLIGPLILHDFFGYHLIRFGEVPSKVWRLAIEAFAGKYAEEEIKKWLEVFIKRFFANQFKRDTMPNGPKVGLLSVSPRGDWRMPADAKVDTWLKELSRFDGIIA